MGVNLDIIKMSDPQANHYGATTDINVKLMEAMEDHVTEGALQPSHFYTSYLPKKRIHRIHVYSSPRARPHTRLAGLTTPRLACGTNRT